MNMNYGEIKVKLATDSIGYSEILKEYRKLEKKHENRTYGVRGAHGWETDYESIYDFEMELKGLEDLMSEAVEKGLY